MGQQQPNQNEGHAEMEKFGRVEHLQSQGKAIMKVAIVCEKSEKELKAWNDRLHQVRSHPEIGKYLVLPLTVERDNCKTCASDNKLSLLHICYERLNYSLSEVIKNRRRFGRHFSESELWYLLYVLVKVANFYEERADCVGNIHPMNVMMSEGSRIQLFTLHSSFAELENLTRIKTSRHFDVYVAPEEIKFITEDSMVCINDCNHNKVDLFNIGLVLLSTALLKDCYYIYNRNLFELDHNKLYKLIQEMKTLQGYSSILLKAVEECLVIDPQQRRTPTFYYTQLRRHEQEIEKLEEFKIHSLLQAEAREKDCFKTPEVGKDKGSQQYCTSSVLQYEAKTVPLKKDTTFLSLARNLRTAGQRGRGEGDVRIYEEAREKLHNGSHNGRE